VTFLYILLAIVLVLVGLLSIKLKVVMLYTDEFRCEVRWMFIKYVLYPSKPKKEKIKEEKEDKPKKEEKKEEPKEKKENILKKFYDNQGVIGIIDLVSDLLSALGGLSKRLTKAIVFDKFNLSIAIASDDSAKTALQYGRICAVLYPTLGEIFSLVKVKKHKIDVNADFIGEKSRGAFDFVIGIIPLFALWAILILLVELIFKVLIKLFLGSKDKTKHRKAEEI